VQILALSQTDRDLVYSAELTDFVEVKKSFATGTPSSTTQFCIITSISHDVRPGSHKVTFGVDSADFSLELVLGDSFAGRLDHTVLDY
jgi:hypothetical protein